MFIRPLDRHLQILKLCLIKIKFSFARIEQTRLSNSDTMTDLNETATNNKKDFLSSEEQHQHNLLHHNHHHHHYHHHHQNYETDSKGRKMSMPLPPIELFVDDPEDKLAQKLTNSDKSTKSEPIDSIKTLKNKKESRVNAFRQASTSVDTIDTVSSDNDFNSDGSEFGSGSNLDELQKKLPDVQAKIAELLKLNVKKFYHTLVPKKPNCLDYLNI